MSSRIDAGRRAGLNVYLLALALACLVPVVAVSGFAAWRTGAAYKSTAATRLSDTALTLASAMEADIEGRYTALSTFAALWPLTTQTGELVLRSSRFEGIGLDGEVEIVEWDHGMPRGVHRAPVLDVAMQAISRDMPAISNLVPGRTAADHRIFLALPEGDGRQRAVVLAISPTQLIRTLQQRNEALGSILVAVTDGNGRIVARSHDPERAIGKRAPDWEKLEALGTDSGWFEARTTEGQSIILAFEKLQSTPGWTLVVGEPLDVFNARWQDPLLGLILGALFAVALATVAAILIGRLILRPVRALAAHSMAIAEGQQPVGLSAIPSSSVREFETLRLSVEAAERTMREEDRLIRTVAQAGALMLWRWTESDGLIWVEGWEKLTGMPDGEALKGGWLDRVHADDRQRVLDVAGRQVEKRALVDVEFRVFVDGGRWLWVRGRGGPVFDDSGKVLQWAGVLEDIDARKQAEAQIAHMAHHDALTGLGNRILLRSRLEQAIAEAASGQVSAILSMDLDRFKQVNDTLGHPVGDALLCAVAGRLRATTRESDLVARIGGDEFAIIQTGAPQPESAAALAHRLVEAVGAPYEIDGHVVEIGTSIGITFIATADIDADEYLSRADKALYYAKQDGRGRATLYEEGHMTDEINRLLAKFDKLKRRHQDAA